MHVEAETTLCGEEPMEPRRHLDSHELHDWPIYGPRDLEIANLVHRLAYDHDFRLREIEEIILRSLQERIGAAKAGSTA